MASLEQLRGLVAKLATRSDPSRAPGWKTSLGISVAGRRWLKMRADEHGIEVADWMADGSAVSTEIEMSAAGLKAWLLSGIDYTHLLKRGEIEVRSGSQFDLLLLSKSFGLRPERQQEIVA